MSTKRPAQLTNHPPSGASPKRTKRMSTVCLMMNHTYGKSRIELQDRQCSMEVIIRTISINVGGKLSDDYAKLGNPRLEGCSCPCPNCYGIGKSGWLCLLSIWWTRLSLGLMCLERSGMPRYLTSLNWTIRWRIHSIHLKIGIWFPVSLGDNFVKRGSVGTPASVGTPVSVWYSCFCLVLLLLFLLRMSLPLPVASKVGQKSNEFWIYRLDFCECEGRDPKKSLKK